MSRPVPWRGEEAVGGSTTKSCSFFSPMFGILLFCDVGLHVSQAGLEYSG